MAVIKEVDRMWVVTDPLEIVRCRSPQQKPFLRLKLTDGTYLDFSLTFLESLGREAESLRFRQEIQKQPEAAVTPMAYGFKGPRKEGSWRTRT